LAFAHGGVYHGPGDTVPPGGSGGGGGAGAFGPAGPGPSTGGPSGPAGPGPATGGPATGGPSRGGVGPSTGPGAGATDLTTWEFEGFLAKCLADPNQEIHETAALAIGILGNDSGAKLLASLLQDDPKGRALVGHKDVDYRTRAFAAYGLGLIGSSTASAGVR